MAGVLLLSAVASDISQGYGKALTATTNIATVAVLSNGNPATAEIASVTVTGDETVSFLKNVGTNSYNSFVLTNAIAVPAGGQYTFKGGDVIRNLGYATTTSTSTFFVAFE